MTQEPAAVNDQQLQNYQLARDRSRREVRPPVRYGYSDSVAFAFTSFHELVDSEPKTYREVCQVNVQNSGRVLC